MPVALRDGTVVRLRPVRAGDEPGLRALLERLSPESRRLRFFDAAADLDRKAGWAASQGGGRGFGLVALAGSPKRIVGHAACVGEAGGRAEIAFEVEDALQGRGLGRLLLRELLLAARAAGVDLLLALVDPSNRRMAELLRHAGFAEERGPTELRFSLQMSPTRRAA
jgi:GNAT superfamily N-acetyltransferase